MPFFWLCFLDDEGGGFLYRFFSYINDWPFLFGEEFAGFFQLFANLFFIGVLVA